MIYVSGIGEFIPTMKKKPKGHVKGEDPWLFQDEFPNVEACNKLFAEYCATIVTLIMNNHVYRFENDIRVQRNEGGIGLTLTGVLSELKMLSWWMKLD